MSKMNQINLLCILCAIILSTGQSAYIPFPVYTYPALNYPGYPSPAATPAITSTSSNILRTPGNLGQISTYHKSVDTPFSSVRKSDVRISNDALTVPAATVHLATPVHVSSPVHVPVPVHAPVHAVHTAPVAITYSSAPAVAHFTFDGFGTHYNW